MWHGKWVSSSPLFHYAQPSLPMNGGGQVSSTAQKGRDLFSPRASRSKIGTNFAVVGIVAWMPFSLPVSYPGIIF